MSWFRLLPELLNPVGSPQTRSSPRKAPNVIVNETEEDEEDDDDHPLISFDDSTRVSTNQPFDSFLLKKKTAKHRFSGHITAENCHTLLQEVLHLTVTSQLGTGCFATGFSVQRPTDQKSPLVCKTYMFGRNYDYRRTSGVFGEYRANRLVTFQREISLYKQLSHPNIVIYHSAFQIYSQLGDDSALELLIDDFELQTNDESTEKLLLISGLLIEQLDYTLERYLSLAFPNQRPPAEIIESIFLQIGAALTYLHRDLSVAHLDLKADNIGVTVNRHGDYTLKLFDFGNSKRFSSLLYEAAESYFLAEAETANQIQAEAVENPFLGESATFAHLLMSLATSCKLIDLEESCTFQNESPSLPEEVLQPRSNFELSFHGNEKLKQVLLAMVPEVGVNCSTVHSGRVTVNWALMEYQKTTLKLNLFDNLPNTY